jgi:hypothetical protein
MGIQDMSKIPLKYHKRVLFYTKYTHPTLICGGTDGRTNIYSIFRDKLLLLGEHVFKKLDKPSSIVATPMIESFGKSFGNLPKTYLKCFGRSGASLRKVDFSSVTNKNFDENSDCQMKQQIPKSSLSGA